jgi:parallel beta-helix repeat protein
MRFVLGLAAVLVGFVANASAQNCPILGPDSLRCQQGVGRAGAVYVKMRMKAVQQCLNKIQSGDLTGDPVTVCRGTPGVPPTDQTTADKVARAEGRVASILAGKCSDPVVASLGLCAATVPGLATCLIDDHFARTDAALEEEYGTVVAGGPQEQECQAAVAKWAGKYLSTRVKAIARCFDTRNKRVCGSTDPLPNCLSPSATGPSAERSAAKKIQRAADKMVEKIGDVCMDAEVAALDACGSTVTTLDDCLFCSHNNAAALLVAGQYQAVHAANPAGPSLQSIADAANDGDTILLEPGTYLGQTMELKDSNLSLIGIKTCDTGARAILLNDPMTPADNGIISCGSLTVCPTPDPMDPDQDHIADNLLFQGFEVNDYDANDIFTGGADGVTYRDMITRGPGTNPGTEYGVFPVLSNNVLVEDCLVEGVRDAGIYVGQSTNIIVRNNEVFGNPAGIEIENSANAEVYGNYAHDNSGGILIFKLVLPVEHSNCHVIRDNIVTNNNTPNFGSGLVGDVPVGTGMLILSNDSGVFQNNTVTGNDTFGIVLTDQEVLNLLFDPDPFPVKSSDYFAENNSFVGNTQTGNGSNPDPFVPAAFASNGAVVITGGAPGTGNCADDLPRFCKLAPMTACTSDAACGVNGPCFGSYFWNVLPACPAPPVQPGCPFVPPPSTTSTTSTTSTLISTTTSTSVLYTWTQVQALLASSCTPCHTTSSSGGLTGLNDYNLGYTNTVNAPSSELVTMDRIEPSDSANSYLMHKLDGTHLGVGGSGVQMPAFSTPLAEDVRNSIRAWIDAGALQN